MPRAREQQRYGRYELLCPIASGGMAEVFAARLSGEGGFQKLVALKRMHRHLAEDENFVRMFLDEGRLAASISSPYVVATQDLGRSESGELYMVLDLVVGVSLSALLRHAEGAAPEMWVEILAQAAMGLHHAHEAKAADGSPLAIVHRDVSPQNILVGLDGCARLTDFGVAHALQRLTTTAADERKGKYAYFSPEQARGEALDRRSDIFALGVVAWESLTGSGLYRSSSPLETMRRIVDEAAPPASSLADIPEELSDAVARALARDREQRFQTAAEMATALREAANGRLPLPSASELGSFVRDHGGGPLARLQAQLTRAARKAQRMSPNAQPASSPPIAEHERSTPAVTRPVPRGEGGHPLGDAQVAAPAAGDGEHRIPAARGRARMRTFALVAGGMAAITIGAALAATRTPLSAPVVAAPGLAVPTLEQNADPNPSPPKPTIPPPAPRAPKDPVGARKPAARTAASAAPAAPSVSSRVTDGSPLVGVDAFDRHAGDKKP